MRHADSDTTSATEVSGWLLESRLGGLVSAHRDVHHGPHCDSFVLTIFSRRNGTLLNATSMLSNVLTVTHGALAPSHGMPWRSLQNSLYL